MDFTIYISDKAIEEEPELKRYVEALQKMAARMDQSHYKYGNMSDAYPDNVNALASADTRRQKYMETGNTEYLLDEANFAVIEHLFPSRKKAYFKAEPSSKSPGLEWRE